MEKSNLTVREQAKRSACAKIGAVILMTIVLTLIAGVYRTPHVVADDVTEKHEFHEKSSHPLPDGTLDSYLVFAAANNPGLKASYHNWKAALERIPQASSLPDPTISYGYFIENVETRVGPQNQKFSLKQSFPWFGTLGNMKEIADEAAGAAYQKFQSQRLKLFYQVKAAYYDFYLLGREIEITKDNMELLKYWESVARTRYKAGLTGSHNVIRAQVELGKLENRLTSLEESKAPLASRRPVRHERVPPRMEELRGSGLLECRAEVKVESQGSRVESWGNRGVAVFPTLDPRL